MSRNWPDAIQTEPDSANGLLQRAEAATDIPVTTRADKAHQTIGHLARKNLSRVQDALALAQGFAGEGPLGIVSPDFVNFVRGRTCLQRL